MTPGLNLRVENTLQGDGSEMAVPLQFNSIEDFDPAKIVAQVPALKQLLDTRNKLRDLMTKMDVSPELEKLLEDVMENTENLRRLAGELGTAAPTDGQEGQV